MSFLETIKPASLETEMKNSYLDYSMSVIVSRALPDVRDGLKPVHRRILYAMNKMGIGPRGSTKKSARIVGEVMGKYHPHGDSSIYDAMVRLGQEWNTRYMLIEGQGNFGSVDGDAPGAMRYTEAKLSFIATEMLRDIDKDTVDLNNNFDDSLKEPAVLPAGIPNLLVNGSSGIAVGMATNMPPHNLREVIDAIQAYIKNKDISDDELLKFIPAPDFPTGGIIYGTEEVKNIYLTGRGKVVIRAVSAVETYDKDRQRIVFTEIPYQMNKERLAEKVTELVNTKIIDGITDFSDESDKNGIRIVIELAKDAIADIVLNKLYKYTQLQTSFGAIMLALVNGRPKVCTLRELIQYFVEHRNEVLVRRSKFELAKAEARVHILQGYIIALDNIDEVIKIIKASASPEVAAQSLMAKFGFSEIQVKAILEMRLQRLTGLEREKIENELAELEQVIAYLKDLLASPQMQLDVIHDDLGVIRDKYGDDRKSRIMLSPSEFRVEDLIANEEMIISITRRGNIKRTPVSSYRKQNKGGRGLNGAATNEDDFVEHVFQASTHHFLLFFTDKGRCYKVKVYDLPEGTRNSKGRSIANVIAKQGDEKITAYLPVSEFVDEAYVVFCTENGTVKKTELSAFENVRNTGIIAINLQEDDRLINARLTNGNSELIIGTQDGLACRFLESDVRPMGRSAAGVRGISLMPGDKVIGMIVINRPDAQVLVVSENGLGKRTLYTDFRLTRRAGKGVISMNVTQKTGKVVGLLTAFDTQDLVVMTTNGVLIRQNISDIRTIGRNTQGVKLIRLDEGDSIADITTVTRDDDDTNDIETEEATETTVDDKQEVLFN